MKETLDRATCEILAVCQGRFAFTAAWALCLPEKGRVSSGNTVYFIIYITLHTTWFPKDTFHQRHVDATSPKLSVGVQLSFSGCSFKTGPRTPPMRATVSRSCPLPIRISNIILWKRKVLASTVWADALQKVVPSR